MKKSNPPWTHPGGKLIEMGTETLTREELLAILIGTGYKGRTAQNIAKDFFDEFYSFYGLLGKKPADLLKIKGLKGGKIKRIAAAYEITKRIILESQWNLPAVRKISLELPALSDAGLLAILIGSGYKDNTPVALAKELLKKYSSLSGIMGQKLSDMANIKGLGDVKVVRIAAAYEIVARVVKILEAE
jgi:DNA repair protein RadC